MPEQRETDDNSSTVILASQSVTRQQLLRNAQVDFEIFPADIDERGVQTSSGLKEAAKIAELLAKEKARHVAKLRPGRFVIGADQTMALGNRIFSKPVDRAAAAQQLRDLSGNTHQLHSAVAVAKDDELLFAYTGTAQMTMRPLTKDITARYLDLAGNAVTKSVGGYQLEDVGVHLFERIEGDYFTILGLPLLPLLGFLRSVKLTAV
ncbi:MAG: Maf family nucleotide pyrophosphatase [Xanthobacteraceae bacterium]|nr:Maf family nucleotide pyrophosphatase [Xanthobacteraceae bacterium]